MRCEVCNPRHSKQDIYSEIIEGAVYLFFMSKIKKKTPSKYPFTSFGQGQQHAGLPTVVPTSAEVFLKVRPRQFCKNPKGARNNPEIMKSPYQIKK